MMNTLHYLENGSGQPLILLHSGGMSSAEWEPQQAALGQRFRVIAPDLPGHGESAMVAQTLSIGDCGRAVLALQDQLGIDKASLVGSSMGGAVALWLAVHYPQRVEKLVLFRVSYTKNAATHSGTRDMADPAYWRSVGLERWLSRLHTPQGGPEAWQEVIKRVSQALDPATSDHNHSLDTLAQIPHSTLIVCGDRDPLVPLDQVLAMHQAIPHSGLWLLPYTTHVSATNTWRSDSFALEITRFVQGRGVVAS